MKPKTFLVGITEPCHVGISDYLIYTKQENFKNDWHKSNVSDQLKLISMFAKLCYKSLVLGRNKNITKVRNIQDNIKSIIDSGHGSVLEHITFNFITTDCSRVFTHELVRHRVGTAFSQTSGRYCAIDADSSIVLDDPILKIYRYSYAGDTKAPYENETLDKVLGSWFNELKNRINALNEHIKENYPSMTFDQKKKLTSALRRIAPNGQSNEIAWSVNLRQLRHMIEMRTSIFAEWEIQIVFKEVAQLIFNLDKMYLYGGTKEVDGSWTGLKI